MSPFVFIEEFPLISRMNLSPRFFLLVAVLFSSVSIGYSLSGPSTYLSNDDRAYYKRVLLSAQQQDGSFSSSLSNTYFTIAALKSLKVEIPSKDRICSFAKTKTIEEEENIESLFYRSSILENLNCGSSVNEKTKAALMASLKTASFNRVLHAVSTISVLMKSKNIELSVEEMQSIHDRLWQFHADGLFRSTEEDEDGSVLNTGYALEIFSEIISNEKFKAVKWNRPQMERLLENALSAALLSVEEEEEEGEKAGIDTLQFLDPQMPTDSLQVTSIVFRGLAKLTAALGLRMKEISEEKVQSIAEFFIANKYSGNAKDIYYVLEGLKTCAHNPFFIPIGIFPVQTSFLASVKGSESYAKFMVCDVLGNFAAKVKVILIKAAPSNSPNKPLLSNQELEVVDGENSKPILYQFNFMNAKPELSFYTLEFRVVPIHSNSNVIPITSTLRTLKVSGIAVVSDIELAVSESHQLDGIREERKFSLEYPKSLDDPVEIGSQENVFITFKVKNQISGKPMQVHQAFIRISNVATGEELFFICKYSGKQYTSHFAANDLLEPFYGRSGSYLIELIVGDSVIQNSIIWSLANSVQIHFANDTEIPLPPDPFAFKPEIHHIFRVAAERPKQSISMAFTFAVLMPILIFVGGLILVGANMRNFPSGLDGLYALGFQCCVGAIFTLFIYYWLSLTMIQTLIYLLILSIPYMIFSKKALNALAIQNEKTKID